MNNQKSQYEAVCDMKDCEQILDINEHIHIWDNGSLQVDNGRIIAPDEKTICESCHQDYYDDLKSKGYSHDEEEEDE